MSCRLVFALVLLVSRADGAPPQKSASDPLPSWNEGAAKRSILELVRVTTDRASEKYVPPEERIATFDNDGTLWAEQPIYVQIAFAMDRVRALAPQHPEWKTAEPFATVLTGDPAALRRLELQEVEKILAVTHSGMSPEEFSALVKKWLATAKHPRFNRSYPSLVYQPMLEALALLRAHQFKTYIVTGGGQEFVRVFAESVYGVPPEQVIGTATKTKFEIGAGGQAKLIKQPEVLLIDDKAGKPEAIQFFIGRRPIAAFGNSTGDQQMLEWTDATARQRPGDGSRLMMLIHHDDPRREYWYGENSKIGSFPDSLLAEAKRRSWIVVSMSNDWKEIFPSKRPVAQGMR